MIIREMVAFLFVSGLLLACNVLGQGQHAHRSRFQGGQEADEQLHQSQIPPPFKQPSVEEVREALQKEFGNMDANRDNFVTSDELKKMLESNHDKILMSNVDRQWRYYEPQVQEIHTWDSYNPEMKEVLHWDQYKNTTYPDELMDVERSPHATNLKKMLKRAERRWKLADANEDGILIRDEFKDFIHPEESNRTREVLVLEATEDMDKDNNGDVSLDEYMTHISSMAHEGERRDRGWAQMQQNHFATYLDKNKDGSLNKEELTEWLTPSYDRHEAEAWRLISMGDRNRDQKLDVDEVVDHHQQLAALLPPEFWAQYHQGDPYSSTPSTHQEL